MSEQPHPYPRVVIVTGVSGAGRRTAAHALEDLGYFTVDNLPPSMLVPLLDLAREQGMDKVTVVLDVRGRQQLEQLGPIFQDLLDQGCRIDVLYIEASDEVIVKRQESVRRPLPLQADGRLLEGIERERDMLATLRANADMVIDTSNLNVHQLRDRVSHAYGGDLADEVRICLVSFGFKNGLPIDADMVFDVRFLPNPHWVPELRAHTGLEEPVRDYVLGQEGAQEYLDQLVALVLTTTRGYLQEGKRLATIAIGCTGGKHRSTAVTEEVARRLSERGFHTRTIHRDLGRE